MWDFKRVKAEGNERKPGAAENLIGFRDSRLADVYGQPKLISIVSSLTPKLWQVLLSLVQIADRKEKITFIALYLLYFL